MRFSTLSAAVAVSASVANGLNILISNDDGFETAAIREMYKAVKEYGHDVWIVASTADQSGTGGSITMTNEPKLLNDTRFGTVKAGSPSVGPDPNDDHIWYYNGSPSMQVTVALGYVLPTFANFSVPDLVLSGPNYGNNAGNFAYTASGTLGVTYTSVGLGIPAIAFSGASLVTVPYYYVNTTTPAGLQDPDTINGRLCANLAQQLINSANGGRILPVGYGVNVNLPAITSRVDTSCVNPPFVHSRLSGGGYTLAATYNETTGLMTEGINMNATGFNTCINGDCSLPGESTFGLAQKCISSVSVFTVDYDAPIDTCAKTSTQSIRDALGPLVQNVNSAPLIGGLTGSRWSNATLPYKTSSTNGTAAATNTAVFTGAAGALSVKSLVGIPAALVAVANLF